MPELPEVESIRVGVAAAVTDKTIFEVQVFHPRVVRRVPGGADALVEALSGQRVSATRRRGKFIWFEFADAALPWLVVHLGMSGQLLVDDVAFDNATRSYPAGRGHERARFDFLADDGSRTRLRFIDQRTFGFLALSVPTRAADSRLVPQLLAHIAPDALELSLENLASRLSGSAREVKRLLLDQGVVSGIGNIYADEALYAARINPSARHLGVGRANRLAVAVRDVLSSALAAGGTSFDALYRNASGEAGYFDRSLVVYGREGQPCPTCGTVIVSVPFAGRHSHFCPRCQAR